MYTTETNAGSDSIAAQRQVSPHTNRYLVPGLSFEGGIFKEQQSTFLTRLVSPNLARMFNGQCGKKRVLQTFMDHYFQPFAPAKDDSDNDATVVLTGSPEPELEPHQPPSPTTTRDAVLVDATKCPVKRCPKALRLAKPLHN